MSTGVQYITQKISNLAVLAKASYFSSSEAKLSGLLTVFLDIFWGAGVLLLAYGLYQIITAFQSDNTENKIKAISLVVVAIAIINIKTIMNTILAGVVKI